MISNNVNNQAFSFLDSVAANPKPNALGDKPALDNDSDTDFEQIANDTRFSR
jgi:hypothetical protein